MTVEPAATEGPLSAPPETVAAIAAAVEVLWPRPTARAEPRRGGPDYERGAPEYVWRLSGRWWSKPIPLRRDRPWATTSREHGQVGTGGT